MLQQNEGGVMTEALDRVTRVAADYLHPASPRMRAYSFVMTGSVLSRRGGSIAARPVPYRDG
ncbi:MAG TPA: hypothetical protein VNY82_05820, partial [Steroidobacteraceae bacterium]|nr:hypothetical protein [Steroidobacteraceae bacterium]